MPKFRTYGSKPYQVAPIHGGPVAGGEMQPMAEELAKLAGILEPLQTEPTILGQVRELKEVQEVEGTPPVTLAGFSWGGAWLSVIFAAKHPTLVKNIILINSSAFEGKYAANIMETRLARLNEEKNGKPPPLWPLWKLPLRRIKTR